MRKKQVYMLPPLVNSEEELVEFQRVRERSQPRGGMVVEVEGQKAVKLPVGNDGLFALIDLEDYELVGRYIWHRHNSRKIIYAHRKYLVDKTVISQDMHRMLIACSGLEVDHINHSGLDNRKGNLRAITHAQNIMNSRTHVNKYKGVSQSGRLNYPWQSSIKSNGKSYALGRFNTQEEAARAYDAAAFSLFGEFAYLNCKCTPLESCLCSLNPNPS